MVARHHLLSLHEHIDRDGGIGHDLVDQPVVEPADQPLVPVVDHEHLLHEVRLLDREGVVGSRSCTITASPATIVAVPSAYPVPRGCRGSRLLIWRLSLVRSLEPYCPTVSAGRMAAWI